jgi:hypothetical protein
MSWDVWGPPLVVLLGGIVAGLILALRAQSGGLEPSTTQAEDLEARKAHLLGRIRTLDADQHTLDPAAYGAAREALIAEAGEVLAAMDLGPVGGASPQPQGPRPSRLGWLVGTVAFFVVLGLVLSKFTADRAPGGSMTGGSGGGMSDGGGATGISFAAEVAKAEAALLEDPDDLAAHNTLTYRGILMQDLQAAMNHVDAARKLSPEDPDVLIHLAILQMMVGYGDRAAEVLVRAREQAGDSGKALLWSAMLAYKTGDSAGSIDLAHAALQRELLVEEQQMAAALVTQARAEVAGTSSQRGTPGASAPTAPPPAGPLRLSGSVGLAEGVDASFGPNATLFLIVRPTEVVAGPPLAARRMDPGALPLEFQLTDGDIMMGGDWPTQVWISARVDADGVPTTKGDDDVVSALLGPFSPGAEGIALTLGGGP